MFADYLKALKLGTAVDTDVNFLHLRHIGGLVSKQAKHTAIRQHYNIGYLTIYKIPEIVLVHRVD
jgi:hypothetical protein